MSESFEIGNPATFTAGAVGEPGRRVFYLQAQSGGLVVSLKCEKQQVAALADYLAGILADLPDADPAEVPAEVELVEPVVPEWTIGSLAVAWDDSAERVVLVAEELLAEETIEAGVEAASARIRLSREQVAAFVTTARRLIEAGRPPCPICGGPLDPEGHVCPRSNGQRR
ncbi:MAG: DUF3090 family protein [Actinobacteria bacterium]|nr:DUF3090 family protein [Actinomycetota bacterium]